jgi:hypothetical protein
MFGQFMPDALIAHVIAFPVCDKWSPDVCADLR